MTEPNRCPVCDGTERIAVKLRLGAELLDTFPVPCPNCTMPEGAVPIGSFGRYYVPWNEEAARGDVQSTPSDLDYTGSLTGVYDEAVRAVLPKRKHPRVQVVLAWYDFWIGAYYDSTRRMLYVLPLPCFGVRIWLGRR